MILSGAISRWYFTPTMDSNDDGKVAICIQIDEFCIKHDKFYTKNAVFCILNDDLNANGQAHCTL